MTSSRPDTIRPTAAGADLNLGIQTYVNSAPMNPVQLDTTQAATDRQGLAV